MSEEREQRAGESDQDLKSESSQFTRKAVIAVALSTAAVVSLAAFYHLFTFILLALAGVLVGIMLSGLADLLQTRTPLSYRWSLVAVCLALCGVAVGVGWWLLPSIIDQTSELFKTLPDALAYAQSSTASLPAGDVLASRIPASLEELRSMTSMDGKVGMLFRTTTGVFSQLAVVLFIGIFLAADTQLYKGGLKRLVPPRYRSDADQVIRSLKVSLQRWLAGRFASMAIIGTIISVGLWIMGIPLPFALGFLAGALSFIPNIGPIISFIPAALVAWMHGGFTAVLYVLALYAGGQAAESYLITPWIQQRLTSVPPALLLFTQLLLGVVGGIWGLILATPLLVVALVLVDEIYVERVLETS